jgi:hypothetical protein
MHRRSKKKNGQVYLIQLAIDCTPIMPNYTKLLAKCRLQNELINVSFNYYFDQLVFALSKTYSETFSISESESFPNGAVGPNAGIAPLPLEIKETSDLTSGYPLASRAAFSSVLEPEKGKEFPPPAWHAPQLLLNTAFPFERSTADASMGEMSID